MEAARPSASTAKSTKDLVPDFILLASVGPILLGFGFADFVDRIALLLLLLTPALIRFITRRGPLSSDQTAYYLAIWYVTLGALDKFEGYGDGEDWVIPAIAAGLFVMTYLLWNMLTSRRLSTLVPVVILVVPVSQAPFDFARNAFARRETASLAGIYVTKITPEHIYGVYFTNPAKVRWVSRTGSERPVIHDNDTKGLGSGTMSPQYSRATSWQRALVKSTFQ